MNIQQCEDLPWQMLLDTSIPFDDIITAKIAGMNKWLNSLAQEKKNWRGKRELVWKKEYKYEELHLALCDAARGRNVLKDHDCKMMLNNMIQLGIERASSWDSRHIWGWGIKQVTDGFVTRYRITGRSGLY